MYPSRLTRHRLSLLLRSRHAFTSEAGQTYANHTRAGSLSLRDLLEWVLIGHWVLKLNPPARCPSQYARIAGYNVHRGYCRGTVNDARILR